MRMTRLLRTSLPALLSAVVSVVPASAVTKVTFLGTDPQFVAPSPVAVGNLLGGAVDAAGNGYFADGHVGTVQRFAPDGARATLLSGLKQPRLAADYRGNVYVADTGNGRVLSLGAGASIPVVHTGLAALGSIAADGSNDYFFLSGNELYEVVRNGDPRKIAAFPGAMLLAYGPATGEDDTMYVLCATGPGSYAVSTYTYHNTSGTVASLRNFQTQDRIDDFGVDAAGNLILAGVTGGSTTHLFEITPDGDSLALTAPVTGTSIHLALDANRTLFYMDAQGIFQFMKGGIDFGQASQQGGAGQPNTLNLSFAMPAGVSVASTSYMVDGTRSGDFEDEFPFAANCNPGNSLCSIPVSYLPQDLGLSGAVMALLDANGNQLIQVPLRGVGVYPMHQLFVPFGAATAYAPTNGSLKSPSGICNSTSLGPLITDVALGSLLTPFSGAFDMTGLGRPETVAHLPAGNTYATQAGMAGVLAIHSDGTQTRVAERLATEPDGVAVDGAGNVYIADHNSIFKVGVDGTETQLADPSTDNGYEAVQSLAVDLSGNVYAFFQSGGPDGHGGLLKIAPRGTYNAIPTGARSAAGLALDSGGGLYFTDAVQKKLEAQRTDGTWMTMLSGLRVPKGVTALYGPLVVDQGSAQILGATLPPSAFDFGNVPVGTTVTKTFTVFALGNYQSSGQLAFDGTDSAFNAGNGYVVEPGGSQTVTITFTPSFPGPHTVQLYDQANDYFSNNPFQAQYTVTGTGVETGYARRQ